MRLRLLLAVALLSVGTLSAAQKTRAELQAELAQMQATITGLQAQAAVETGAPPPPADCEAVLRRLLGRLADLSREGKEHTEDIDMHVTESQGALAQGTSELRAAQNQNAGVAQVAAVKASGDARTSELTQILGFLTVVGTMSFRVWTERQHHSETAVRLDALGQSFKRRSTDGAARLPAGVPPADGDGTA